MFLTKSLWRKGLVTGVAALAFIALYETTMLDSKSAARATSSLNDPIDRAEPGARLAFMATAYCKGLVTAAGVAVQNGIVAADPSILPVGSIVEIDSPVQQHDGIYTVLDTGPAVQGKLVDIYIWSCHEALKFGRRPIRLTVLRLGWNPQATTPGFMARLFRRPKPAPEPLPSRPMPIVAAPEGT